MLQVLLVVSEPWGLLRNLSLASGLELGYSFFDLYSLSFCATIQLRQGFDTCREPVLEDLCGILGYIKAISLILRVRPKGLTSLAIPCNSFGYMSSSQHQRSMADPLGNLSYPFVIAGNMVCLRALILIALGIVRHVHYWVENPERSTLAFHPFFVFLQSLHQMFGHQRSFW